MKKHIFVLGGLGNQMFQYAFYLSCKQKGIPCILDTSEFVMNPSHNGFELKKVFGIKDAVYSSPLKWRMAYYLYKRFIVLRNTFPERIFTYCEDVYYTRKKYLNGNWLNSAYFQDIASSVRKAFVFQDIDTTNRHVSDDMKIKESVSVHIRRGDYLKLPRYCVCDEKYYKDAISLISNKVVSPFYYVFSDDKEWSDNFMRSLNVPYKLITWNNASDSYKDMYLMSQCKHNVIANSTFSWWGAWLNDNPSKLVVQPSTWFTIRQVRIDWPNWNVVNVKRD